MRLSDLIGALVVDVDGEPLGRVSDARIEQDGPLVGAYAQWRLHALLVGQGSVGGRLGYGWDGGPRRPLLFDVVFGRMRRRVRYVAWDVVASVDTELGIVRLRVQERDVPRVTDVARAAGEATA